MGRHTPAHGRTIAAGAVLLALFAAPAAPASEAKRARAAAPAVGTTILGTAWKADNTPIPQARVRLRNVTTGRPAATSVANGRGQFTFASVEPGSYLVELVNDEGKVLALGQVFNIGPGETVATFVRLSARARWFSGFFTNAATSAVTAASSLGVTALGSDGQPVSAAAGNGQ
jgi:Carboxypeptidase regulatory-like domain